MVLATLGTASTVATPPVSVMVLGWVVLVVAVAVVLVRKTRIWPVLVVALGYAVACQIPIYLMRSSRFTALELAQTLRYLPDLVVVLALLAAVGFCAPNRESSRLLSASPARTAVCVSVAVLSWRAACIRRSPSSRCGRTTRCPPI